MDDDMGRITQFLKMAHLEFPTHPAKHTISLGEMDMLEITFFSIFGRWHSFLVTEDEFSDPSELLRKIANTIDERERAEP